MNLHSEKWKEDINLYRQELPKRDIDPFNLVSEKEFNREIDTLTESLPSLESHEIVTELIRITAMVGDGHTSVRWWRLPLRRFPLGYFIFGDKVRIVAVLPGYEDYLGMTVTAIDGVPSADIFDRISTIIPQGESKYYILNGIPSFLQRPEILNALKISRASDSADFTLQDDEGKVRTVTINSFAELEGDWTFAHKPFPEYLQHPRDAALENLWFRPLPDGESIFLKFFRYPGRWENFAFTDRLVKYLKENDVKRMLVDLRGNFGGDFNKGLHLIEGIKSVETFQEPGRVFVATDRGTFSAAMSNAAHFREMLGAILIGEPTGARPNGYQENDEFVLPNSGMEISYSTRYYKFQEEDTPGVIPDVSIPPDWQLYKEGRDPVVEWFLSNGASF